MRMWGFRPATATVGVLSVPGGDAGDRGGKRHGVCEWRVPTMVGSPNADQIHVGTDAHPQGSGYPAPCSYEFLVRALSMAGPDPSPATAHFKT